LNWLDSKLESRNPSDGRRIILCISDRSLVNDEKAFDKLGVLRENTIAVCHLKKFAMLRLAATSRLLRQAQNYNASRQSKLYQRVSRKQ
jgi:hypothetical protein